MKTIYLKDASDNVFSSYAYNGNEYTDRFTDNSFRYGLDIELLNDLQNRTGIDFENFGSAPSTTLTGTFSVSFGADGMANVPFRVEGTEPATTEEGRWVYNLEETGSHPAGQFIITQTEAGFAYAFVPTDENINFDASQIKISAIDGDSDMAEQTVTVSRHLPVSIVDKSGEELTAGADAGEFAVDEGDRPEHGVEETHGGGQNSFTVNLHGQDGKIEVSGLAISIENGEASFDVDRTVGVNGADLSIVSARLNENGRWDIEYSYRYADEAGQTHEVGADKLSGQFSVTAAGSDGQKATGTITAITHDDVPEIESSSREVTAGQTITGEIAYDFGADADGRLILYDPVQQIVKQIGEDGLEFVGQYGTLNITSDGKWTYQANAGVEGTDIFDIRVVDGDGDMALATLKIEKLSP